MKKFEQHNKAVLLLADGTVFEGKSIGIEGTAVGEICFNTGMTGYQEVFYRSILFWSTNGHH
jgi:carbamoyl-phosphate synthase small subunit